MNARARARVRVRVRVRASGEGERECEGEGEGEGEGERGAEGERGGRGRGPCHSFALPLVCLATRARSMRAVSTCTWQGSRAGARFVGCAPLHVEEELAVHRRQLQDDVVRRDGQECPLRLTTSLGGGCCVLPHDHAGITANGTRACRPPCARPSCSVIISCASFCTPPAAARVLLLGCSTCGL